MSIRAVVTRGFGSFGTIADVTRRGYGATGVIPPTPAPSVPAITGAGRSKRRRFTIWEDEEEVVIPVEATPAQVQKAIVRAVKKDTIADLRLSIPDSPRKLDVAGFLEAMRIRDIVYAVKLENAIRQALDDEDEDDIEALLLH